MAALTAVEAIDSSLVMREGLGGPLGVFSPGVEGMLPKLGGRARFWVLPCRDCTPAHVGSSDSCAWIRAWGLESCEVEWHGANGATLPAFTSMLGVRRLAKPRNSALAACW